MDTSKKERSCWLPCIFCTIFWSQYPVRFLFIQSILKQCNITFLCQGVHNTNPKKCRRKSHGLCLLKGIQPKHFCKADNQSGLTPFASICKPVYPPNPPRLFHSECNIKAFWHFIGFSPESIVETLRWYLKHLIVENCLPHIWRLNSFSPVQC